MVQFLCRIIVEEASEVMEPLLFACLSQSTVKFEMIGDHRQLAVSKLCSGMFIVLPCDIDM